MSGKKRGGGGNKAGQYKKGGSLKLPPFLLECSLEFRDD